MSDSYYDDDFGYPSRSRSKMIIGVIVGIILVATIVVVLLWLRSPPPCTEANTPLIQELTASPKIVPIGRRSTLTVLANDPADAALTYVWTATDGELRLPTGALAQGPVPNSTVDFIAPAYTTDAVVSVVVKNTECSVVTRIKIPVVLGSTSTPVPTETPIPSATPLSSETPNPTLTPTPMPALSITDTCNDLVFVEDSTIVHGTSTGIKDTNRKVYLIVDPVRDFSVWVQGPIVGKLKQDQWAGSIRLGGSDTFEIWAIATELELQSGEWDPDSLPTASSDPTLITSNVIVCEK